MKIETMAICYQKGTPEKNCLICYQSTLQKARGLVCEKWDLETTRYSKCGEFIQRSKPIEELPVTQKGLFD